MKRGEVFRLSSIEKCGGILFCFKRGSTKWGSNFGRGKRGEASFSRTQESSEMEASALAWDPLEEKGGGSSLPFYIRARALLSVEKRKSLLA